MPLGLENGFPWDSTTDTHWDLMADACGTQWLKEREMPLRLSARSTFTFTALEDRCHGILPCEIRPHFAVLRIVSWEDVEGLLCKK